VWEPPVVPLSDYWQPGEPIKPIIEDGLAMRQLVPSTEYSMVGAEEQIHFKVEILDVDLDRREVQIHLRVDYSDSDEPLDRHFWVGPYDFPMLDNSQLRHGLRTSVVITDFLVPDEDKRNSIVKLHLVVFPAVSSSFKERQDYDDIYRDMLRTKAKVSRSEDL